MTREEDVADITPYDLAERIVHGQFASSEAAVEVAEELLRVRRDIGAVLRDNGCDCCDDDERGEEFEECLAHAVERALRGPQ